MIEVKSANAQFLGNICINPDGTVTGTDKIQRSGDVYTLTGNLSEGIQVQKSLITIDGAGYTIEGNGEVNGIDLSNGRGQDPSRPEINSVTVKNLKITNCYFAIDNANTNNNTFIGNCIAECDTGFWIVGSYNNTLIHNTIRDCFTGISINYGSSGNVITENNIMSSFLVWLSPEPLVDRNYWSDYLTVYPNAKEIGSSGIWDTPYDRQTFKDNHPLVKPITIPEFSDGESNDGTDKTEPFPALLVVSVTVVVVAMIGLSLLVYFKKRQRKKSP